MVRQAGCRLNEFLGATRKLWQRSQRGWGKDVNLLYQICNSRIVQRNSRFSRNGIQSNRVKVS